MPSANDASAKRDVEVEQFRKHDFEELEAWAKEAGISTDQLAEQILKKAAQFLAQRTRRRENNVVPFGATK